MTEKPQISYDFGVAKVKKHPVWAYGLKWKAQETGDDGNNSLLAVLAMGPVWEISAWSWGTLREYQTWQGNPKYCHMENGNFRASHVE